MVMMMMMMMTTTMIMIIVKKLNSLKQLVRTTVAESHNKNSKYQTATF